MKTILQSLVLFMVVLAAASAAEHPAAKTFAALAGSWQGSGETNGMASSQQMTWEVVLGGQFHRLTLANRMTDADGKEWHFKAQAFYRIQYDGSIAGTWFDSRGLTFPLSGSVDEAGTMTILWGTAETEQGRSSYLLGAEGLEVTDEVLTREGEWRVFGRSSLRPQLKS